MISDEDIKAMDREPIRYRVSWEIHRLLNMIEGEVTSRPENFELHEAIAIKELLKHGRAVRELLNKND